MSKWQPARIIDAHGINKKGEVDEVALRKTIVRICKSEIRSKKHTCDADEFFYVHPDDVAKLRKDGAMLRIVCEHEIQTD
jgi:hypothetical protein